MSGLGKISCAGDAIYESWEYLAQPVAEGRFTGRISSAPPSSHSKCLESVRAFAMPGNDKYDDDDYVARLLAEDAKKSSERYASAGLSALLPRRTTKVAPKPNTRFLSNLVQEVDSHNASLKKKEEVQARARLKEMRGQRHIDGKTGEERRERKRRRIDDDDYHQDDDGRRNRRRERSRERRRSLSRDDKRRHHHDRPRRTSVRHSHERERRRSHRYPSHSPESKSRRHGRLSPSPSRHRRDPLQNVAIPDPPRSGSSSSDPLEDLMRSKQAPTSSKTKVRGRGARTSSKSNIDKHFSSEYDPSLDIHVESESASEREDWDMALEALRDRTAWKKKQSDRLKEAGFNEAEIRKWEKSATPGETGDVKEVKWSKRGETREWDVGKKETK